MKKQSFLFVVLLLGFIAWQFYISHFQYGQTSLIGKAAPLFEVSSVRTNEKLVLSEVIGKKVVLVNFWATWCETCQLEVNTLNTLYKTLDQTHFEFVSLLEDDVSSQDDAKRLLETYNQRWPVEFPVYLDASQVVSDLYGTFKIPETYLIDREGRVVYRHEGAIIDGDLPKLVQKIQEISL